jgi:Amidohydrolase
MMDAYSHLDMSAADPVRDLALRMQNAGVERALIVETWGRDNRACLDELLAAPTPQFRVAPCFRPEENMMCMDAVELAMVGAIRVRTADMRGLGPLAAKLAERGRWLLPHGELGIKALTDELVRLAAAHPELRILVPHMGWPRCDGRDDAEWQECMTALGKLPQCVVGVSAIAHFSCEKFPHNDVRLFVEHLRQVFAADALVTASDYPLFEKARYDDYMQLAFEWIEQNGAGIARLERSLFERESTRT